jgi:hypothetical protein
MEVAGLVIGLAGAVGVLGQIYNGCQVGYKVFSSARNLGRDSDRLVCKVKIEEMRFRVWGREWGIVEGKFEAHLSATAWEGLRELAKDILTQLLSTILDCHKLQAKYGLREEAPGSVDTAAYEEWKKVAEPKTSKPSLGSKLKKEMGMAGLKAKWVIVDKEKFDAFLQELGYYNDRLEKLFPPSKMATLERAWTNELLTTAQRDMEHLKLLETAAGGKYPGLNALAQLKQLRINLDAREPSKKILSSSELKIPIWRLKDYSNEPTDSKHVRAIYQKPTNDLKGSSVSEDVHVLLDWIEWEPDMSMDSRLHIYQRVDNLARMLHSCSSRHPDLHTLDCLGYSEDAANNRYGIIHVGPPTRGETRSKAIPPFQTLSSVIEDNSKRNADLDVRFKLAHTLAIALWSFHSLDWLHKSFGSFNILFFESGAATASEHHNLSSPYVVGFDSSRPDGLTEMTADPKFTDSQELYRHPDSLGMWRQSYRKSFDIYSLGLVLLEIGLWKSIRAVYKPRYSHAVFREKIIQGLAPALGAKTGSIYKSVVERCLTFDESAEKEDMTPHEVLEWVVITLEGLKV